MQNKHARKLTSQLSQLHRTKTH